MPSIWRRLLPGRPVTFGRYTQRRRGKVAQGPLDLLGPIRLSGVYLCARCIPAPGTLGRAMPGWIAAERML
ncbi:hypothetical protein [Paenibacillus caseinilyticus]|uniref:hypothetical protein n=1 Tax=Paenibacillus caseinilyticus TaxID=3098138 RepID=UPI0022B898FF|nr:hypothetical protein [Paenibacillus caseinilyticus]MCZ8518984.1 hypothetical protein [Paenibacillus caseinilyticus]